MPLKADYRREYESPPLRRKHLDPNPLAQFERWFREALEAELPDANAMILATADGLGRPSARAVLLKDYDAKGFVFFTNSESRKGRQILENPRAALVFHWVPFSRQIRIEGEVAELERRSAEEYFSSRPRGSQLAALISRQSETLENREEMQRLFEEAESRFPDGGVPVPRTWSGYRVVPLTVEFWQGQPSRLHDRFLYSLEAGGNWSIRRLFP